MRELALLHWMCFGLAAAQASPHDTDKRQGRAKAGRSDKASHLNAQTTQVLRKQLATTTADRERARSSCDGWARPLQG